MFIVLLVVHVLIAFALVGVVLLQKSEGGALGIGGGGGMSGFMTGRSTANLLTRTTAILAAAFFTTSVLLVILHNRQQAPRSIIDQGTAQRSAATPILPPASNAPASGKPIAPAKAGGDTANASAPAKPAPPAKPAAPAATAPAPTKGPSAPLAR